MQYLDKIYKRIGCQKLSKFKYLINRLNFIVSLFFMNSFNDYTNAFKIYKKDTLIKLQTIVARKF